MSSAPHGSYKSWVIPDGRLVTCEIVAGEINDDDQPIRAYAVDADGVPMGWVIRWHSAAPGRPNFPASVWRARTVDGMMVSDVTPVEWPSRGDAVDYLLGLTDA